LSNCVSGLGCGYLLSNKMLSSTLRKASSKFLPPSTPLFCRLLSSEAMASFTCIKVEEIKPFVYNVEFNRPEKRNAFNRIHWEEVGKAFRLLADDEDCRAIVLSGNGKIFTAGIDLAEFSSFGGLGGDSDVAKKAKAIFAYCRDWQSCISDLERCRKPVIAAVHSACVGGGVDFITAADIRICTQDAYFQVKEVDMGLAADIGTLQRLPKVIGSQSLVRDLCYTCRKLGAEEAERCGFVSGVFKDKDSMMAAAIEMASDIAGKSPVAVQGTKVNLNYARDHSVQDGLEFVATWNSFSLQSEDLMKAAMAAMTKEKAEFSKL